MGICTKAKDIIYCNKITDIPIYSDMLNKNIEQKRNINNHTNLNQSIKETAQKSWGISKEEDKLQEISDIKQLTEIEEEREKEKEKEKQRVKIKFKSVHKKVAINDNSSDLDAEEKNPEKKRGKSAYTRDAHKYINDKEQNTYKFQRNNRKSVTLINNKSLLPEKLHSVEMKIPVMQETLITQKFGNPDKYYKKIKDLGSGSYGNVYEAKNLIFDNIVAIKTIGSRKYDR